MPLVLKPPTSAVFIESEVGGSYLCSTHASGVKFRRKWLTHQRRVKGTQRQRWTVQLEFGDGDMGNPHINPTAIPERGGGISFF